MTKFAKLKFSELKTKKISAQETAFIMQPLERGFANTLGNAMRRILLSSISGVAPFAIKAKGVHHEFQAIENVTEDAVQLILNIKDIKVVYNTNVFAEGEVVKMTLKSHKGKVIAGDFELPAGVKIVNPDLHIATAAKEKALELEVFLIAGRGFSSFEENKKLQKELAPKIDSNISNGSLIAVDSDFSPVIKVSYESKELNSSAAIIEEELTLNVETSGDVEAHEAVAQAANILVEHAKAFINLVDQTEDVFEEKAKIIEAPTQKSKSISMLDLSVRSYNCLKRAGFETLEDLSKLSIEEIASIKNLGKKSVDEIVEKLNKEGVDLAINSKSF